MNFFLSLKHITSLFFFEWALHAQRKHYYYYTFPPKKHYLKNIISTGTELSSISDPSETCSPNLTDPEATNTHWMSGFHLLLSFCISPSHNSILGFLRDIILLALRVCRSPVADFILAPKPGGRPKPGTSGCRITLSIVTGLEVAPWPNPEQGFGWDYGEVAL